MQETSWLNKMWWKWLSVVLLFYVVVGSYTVPLGPGVSRVEPTLFHADSVYTFIITGYHTHFKDAKAGKVQVAFKSGDYYCPGVFKVLDNETIAAQFGINSVGQDAIKHASFDVVVNDDIDGTFSLREGITFIKSETIDSTANKLPLNKCELEVKHNKHQFLSFPYREILYESIRNTFFHVPMWFAMTAMVFFSLLFSILYLAGGRIRYDIYAHQAIVVALLFGLCGYTTGMVWSKYTWFIGMSWGEAIRNMVFQDIKLAGALISIAVYLAYLVLRGSLPDEIKRARISAAYNIFAVVIFTLFIFIMPRLTDSLHPGNGGNPAFSKYDLDSTLRMFFYPAVIGWILLGFWILSMLIRLDLIKQKQES